MSVGAADLLTESEGEGNLATAPGAEIAARSPLQLFWRRLRGDKVALIALAFIVLLLLIAVLAGPIRKIFGAPPPNLQDSGTLDDFGTPTYDFPKHIMGVDDLGRDVFSRVLYGARVSLEVALAATGIAVACGTVAGMIAGYYRGWVDTLISRSIDVLLAFPILLLGLGLGSACSLKGCLGGVIKPGISVVIFIISLSSSLYFARIIRGQVLSLREKEFIEASKSLGASNLRIIFKEVLPNLVAPIIVYSTLIIPTNILFEAALSFLGVGVKAPNPSWGQMIADAVSIFNTAWWYMFFPGLALLLTVLAFNLVGDGLQDALNPKSGR
ncbi:MAG TPA: ABC transporter permease [Solirubrobacteraceae bacterium]|jgi:peptide/nickel transport system permease protein